MLEVRTLTSEPEEPEFSLTQHTPASGHHIACARPGKAGQLGFRAILFVTRIYDMMTVVPTCKDSQVLRALVECQRQDRIIKMHVLLNLQLFLYTFAL